MGLSKSKAQKEPPCNTSSHKVSEACTVAEHSGKYLQTRHIILNVLLSSEN